MSYFKCQADMHQEKIFKMLNYCESSDDFFVRFFVESLADCFADFLKSNDGHIQELEKRIVQLEKELIFANLPEENHK